MELNDLAIFRQVARLGSMSAAAERLGYVQSNITARVRQLERELHTELFERTARGVKLLPAGERLLLYADRILELVEQAQTEFKRAEAVGTLAALRIGATPTITASYLTEAIWNGQLALEVYTRSTSELIQMLLVDELDGILLNRPWYDEAETVVCRFAIQEKVGWAVPISLTSDRSATQDKSWPARLAAYPLLVIRDNDCPYRQTTLAYVQRYDNYVWNVRSVDTLDMLLTLIRQGKGVAILPKRILQNDAQSTERQHIQIHWQPLLLAEEQPAYVQIAYYERQREQMAVLPLHTGKQHIGKFAHPGVGNSTDGLRQRTDQNNDHKLHWEHKATDIEGKLDQLRHLMMAGSENESYN